MDDDGETLICETHRLTHSIADELLAIPTPKADALLSSMSADTHKNVCLKFPGEAGQQHDIVCNKRLTNRGKSLEKIKKECTDAKQKLITNMACQIRDQNGEDTLAYKLSCLDLLSTQSAETHENLLFELYKIWGEDRIHKVKAKWLVNFKE